MLGSKRHYTPVWRSTSASPPANSNKMIAATPDGYRKSIDSDPRRSRSLPLDDETEEGKERHRKTQTQTFRIGLVLISIYLYQLRHTAQVEKQLLKTF